MRSEFPGAVPEIPVSDISASSDYYRQCLGFHLDWNADDIGLAGISRGDCRMFLANTDYRKEFGNAGPTVIWLNLESEKEVDELYREWSDAQARSVSAPERKPWGLYEFTAADLDGNLFRAFYDFATPERTENV